MADNRGSRYASNEPSFLSDDDPLAELARIAGHGPIDRYGRPTEDAVTLPESFDLDLEAELMREFEERAASPDKDDDAPDVDGAPVGQVPESYGDEDPAPRDDLATEDIPAFLKTRHSMPEEAEEPEAAPDEDASVADAIAPEALEQELAVLAGNETSGVEFSAHDSEAVVPLPDSEYVAPAELEATFAPSEPKGAEEVAAEASMPAEPAPESDRFDDIAEEWTDLPEWERPQSALRSDLDTEQFASDDRQPDPIIPEPDEAELAGDAAFDAATEDAREEATIAQAAAHDDAMLLDDEDLSDAPAGFEAEETASVADFAPARDGWEPHQPELVRESMLGVKRTELPLVAVEEEPVAGPAFAEQNEPPHASGAEPEPIAAGTTRAAPDEDDVWSHFARYEVPSREPVTAPVVATAALTAAADPVAAMPSADRAGTVIRDEWDIADEIERAFLDIRSSASPEPVLEPEPAFEPEAVAAAETELAYEEPQVSEPAAFEAEPRFQPEPVPTVEAQRSYGEPQAPEPATFDLEPASVAAETPEPFSEPHVENMPEAAAADEATATADPHIDINFDDLELELTETSRAVMEDDRTDHAAPATLAAAGLAAAYAARSAAPEIEPSAASAMPHARHEQQDGGQPVLQSVKASSASFAAGRNTFEPAPESVSQPDHDAAADRSTEHVAERWHDDDRDIAFDVREVSDMDRMVEPMAEIDVPELPRDDAVPERSPDDDFDLSDLEAEFADVLAREEAVGKVEEAEGAPAAGTEPDAIDFAQYDFAELGQSPKGRAAAAVAQDRGESGIPVHQGDVQTAIDRDLEFADFDNEQPRPAGGSFLSSQPKWKIGAVAAVLLCGVALGALALSGGGAPSSGEPRVIAANDEPMKIVPEDRGGRDVPNQDQAVYNQVDGSGGDDEINLVSRSEEPIDVVRRTIDPQVLPLEGRPDPSSPQAAALDGGEVGAGADMAALDQDPAATEPEQEEVPPRIAVTPRRVETMVVRADGTLVPRSETETPPAAAETTDPDETLASGQLMTPPGEDGVGESFVDAGQGDDIAAIAAASQEGAAEDAAPPTRLLPQEESEETAMTAPVRTVRTTAITGSAEPVVPTERPIDQPANIVGNTADQTRSAPAGQTETAALGSADQPLENPGGYVVQIASQPSEESARATYQSLSQRFGSIIGGRDAQIQSAEIPDRGTFYRVRIAGGTREEATALCERYQAAGGSCFVAR